MLRVESFTPNLFIYAMRKDTDLPAHPLQPRMIIATSGTGRLFDLQLKTLTKARSHFGKKRSPSETSRFHS